MRHTFLAIGLLLALAAGCTQVPTFRVVDANSHQPIEGVDAERLHGSIQFSPMPFVLLNSLAPVERKTTDQGGSVKFEQTGDEFAFNPRLNDPEYGKAFVATSWTGIKVRYPEQCREITVQPINGVIEVPLLHRGQQVKDKEGKSPFGSAEIMK